MRISERRENPFLAKEVAMRCDACGKFCFGKRSLMREAMNEHRRLCPAIPPEEKHVYELWYPRA